ncbi:F-box/kelch-repeat protein At3g06240-like [Coffea arabica]|uniref:F-box/kelch-repeat protein At3g06240-like n=1 Tax=Coffea arabica TaxID=13443 RepID=A0A6P6X9V5_COFAR|nr:F-box/kelch-repeat protein At3g06240-like [Coffea arabica]
MSLKQLDQSQMPVSTADLAPNVPQELIIDVLLRLPAKSVGKFRSVSKSWRSLLSDPVFIKAHLDLHLHHSQKFILSSSPPTEKSTLSTLSFNPTGSADNDGVSKKLTLLENKLTGATIIGSCNGLVIVSKFKRRSPDTKYYLINPTTMELVGIPANPLAPWARRGGIALGYDRSNDDYKIVMFFGSDKVNNDAYLDVFSLRSGTWRRIDVLCDRPADVKGVFLNGAVHWLGECDGSLIMSCDLSSEEFKPLPGPSSPPEDSFFDRIAVFGGCLAVVAFTGYSTKVSMMNRGFYMDVWMMKEYGVQESWTKYRPNTHPNTCLSLPVCLLGDDDLVLHVHQSLHKLVVHSLTGETKRDMLVTGIGNAFRDVKGFCESVVLPIFYCQKWNQHKLGV